MVYSVRGGFAIAMNTVPFALRLPGNSKVVGVDFVKVIGDLWGLSFSGLIVLALGGMGLGRLGRTGGFLTILCYRIF
jgi:hypothetical protein